ncbi:hypothetical protein [Mesorhizobium sp. M0060]|uniref:hypothetical protein n=1 Tax=Mesorhizobium sp. M0060 TaxID=2956866 RepID=UPI0033362FB0
MLLLGCDHPYNLTAASNEPGQGLVCGGAQRAVAVRGGVCLVRLDLDPVRARLDSDGAFRRSAMRADMDSRSFSAMARPTGRSARHPGAREAAAIMVCIDDPKAAMQIVEVAQHESPGQTAGAKL